MKTKTLKELKEQVPQPPRENRQGLLIVNTGNGKGKTSASLGVAFRALWWNWKVRIIQFIKGNWITGEKRILTAPLHAHNLKHQLNIIHSNKYCTIKDISCIIAFFPFSLS